MIQLHTVWRQPMHKESIKSGWKGLFWQCKYWVKLLVGFIVPTNPFKNKATKIKTDEYSTKHLEFYKNKYVKY